MVLKVNLTQYIVGRLD